MRSCDSLLCRWGESATPKLSERFLIHHCRIRCARVRVCVCVCVSYGTAEHLCGNQQLWLITLLQTTGAHSRSHAAPAGASEPWLRRRRPQKWGFSVWRVCPLTHCSFSFILSPSLCLCTPQTNPSSPVVHPSAHFFLSYFLSFFFHSSLLSSCHLASFYKSASLSFTLFLHHFLFLFFLFYFSFFSDLTFLKSIQSGLFLFYISLTDRLYCVCKNLSCSAPWSKHFSLDLVNDSNFVSVVLYVNILAYTVL